MHLAGKSVEGRPIHYHELGDGEKIILFIATIHGNENAGTPLMHTLMDYLQRRPDLLEGYKAVIIPVMNPDGYAKNTRGNANGVDLNRNFPATNRENSKRYGMSALSEPESKIVYDMLHSMNPERIVVMHQPWAIVDWDGPGQPLAQHMAWHTIHPEKRIGARPGSLGSHAGVDLQIPIITWELPGKAHELSPERLWHFYGRSLVAAITYPNEIPLQEFRAPYPPEQRKWYVLAPLGILVAALILVGGGIAVWERRKR
jgi:protein MpaA